MLLLQFSLILNAGTSKVFGNYNVLRTLDTHTFLHVSNVIHEKKTIRCTPVFGGQ